MDEIVRELDEMILVNDTSNLEYTFKKSTKENDLEGATIDAFYQESLKDKGYCAIFYQNSQKEKIRSLFEIKEGVNLEFTSSIPNKTFYEVADVFQEIMNDKYGKNPIKEVKQNYIRFSINDEYAAFINQVIEETLKEL